MSRDGLLGSQEVSIRAFQDFFVDLELPVSLTLHDQVQVRAGVYSYLDRPQRVRLDLERGDWFDVQGATSRELTLAPRQITKVDFTLTARRPGEHALVLRVR